MFTLRAVIVTFPCGREERHPCLSHAEAVATALRLWRETEADWASVRIEEGLS